MNIMAAVLREKIGRDSNYIWIYDLAWLDIY